MNKWMMAMLLGQGTIGSIGTLGGLGIAREAMAAKDEWKAMTQPDKYLRSNWMSGAQNISKTHVDSAVADFVTGRADYKDLLGANKATSSGPYAGVLR
jgi:hypothetical protein